MTDEQKISPEDLQLVHHHMAAAAATLMAAAVKLAHAIDPDNYDLETARPFADYLEAKLQILNMQLCSRKTVADLAKDELERVLTRTTGPAVHRTPATKQ